MYNDLKKAKFVLEGMKQHNPNIPITVYNGGQSFPELVDEYGVELIEGPNLWHNRVRSTPIAATTQGGSFDYRWFDSLYGIAEKYNPEYLIFLETDVKINDTITDDPEYDISGPVHMAAPFEQLIVYDYWTEYVNGREPIGGYSNPFLGLSECRWPHKFHTGMGGTAFSRNFFNLTKDKLYMIKQCFDQIPMCFHHDVVLSCFARHCGCTLGDWSEVTDTRGMLRFHNDKWYAFPYQPEKSLIHSFEV